MQQWKSYVALPLSCQYSFHSSLLSEIKCLTCMIITNWLSRSPNILNWPLSFAALTQQSIQLQMGLPGSSTTAISAQICIQRDASTRRQTPLEIVHWFDSSQSRFAINSHFVIVMYECLYSDNACNPLTLYFSTGFFIVSMRMIFNRQHVTVILTYYCMIVGHWSRSRAPVWLLRRNGHMVWFMMVDGHWSLMNVLIIW